jgi:hypothetical protein
VELSQRYEELMMLAEETRRRETVPKMVQVEGYLPDNLVPQGMVMRGTGHASGTSRWSRQRGRGCDQKVRADTVGYYGHENNDRRRHAEDKTNGILNRFKGHENWFKK